MSKKEAQHRSLASVHKHPFLLPHTYINSHKRSHIRTKQNIIDMLVEMTFQSKHFRLGILFPHYECWMLFFFSFLDENRFSWRRQLGKIQVPPSTYCRPGGWRGWKVCVSFLTSHSLTSGWKSVEQHQLLLTAFGSWRKCRIFKTQTPSRSVSGRSWLQAYYQLVISDSCILYILFQILLQKLHINLCQHDCEHAFPPVACTQNICLIGKFEIFMHLYIYAVFMTEIGYNGLIKHPTIHIF